MFAREGTKHPKIVAEPSADICPLPPSPLFEDRLAGQLWPPAPPSTPFLPDCPGPPGADAEPPAVPSPALPAESTNPVSTTPRLAFKVIAMLAVPLAVSSFPTTTRPETAVAASIPEPLIAGDPGGGLAWITVR